MLLVPNPSKLPINGNIKMKPSTLVTLAGKHVAGNGGFVGEGRSFLKGDIIYHFRGDILSYAEKESVYEDHRGYIIKLLGHNYLDCYSLAKRGLCLASMCNNPDGLAQYRQSTVDGALHYTKVVANAKICTSKSRAWLVAWPFSGDIDVKSIGESGDDSNDSAWSEDDQQVYTSLGKRTRGEAKMPNKKKKGEEVAVWRLNSGEEILPQYGNTFYNT